MSVIGYKAFDTGYTCRDFQYEIGKTYTLENGKELKICGNGFHFCRKLKDVFKYYPLEISPVFAVVEALGKVIDDDDKSVTDKIKIVKKLTLEEVMAHINSDITEQCDIEDGVLLGVCKVLETFTIPDNVMYIGDGAFCNCENLTTITIPDSVTSIGDHAFYGCGNLTEIHISDGISSINDRAFCNCKHLTTITIPDSVTSIDKWAFCGCKNITDVYYNGTEEHWNKIEMIKENTHLTSATIHFASDNA